MHKHYRLGVRSTLLVAIGIFFISLIVGVWSLHFNNVPSAHHTGCCGGPSAAYAEPVGTQLLTQKNAPGEKSSVLGTAGNAVVVTEPQIASRADLLAYIVRGRERLKQLNATTPVSAQVTFRQPLMDEGVQTLEQAGINIVSATYLSWPEGMGEHPYPLPEDIVSTLQAVEEDIAAHLREDGVEDFSLVSGYVGVSVMGNQDQLRAVQRRPDVLLVDVGAVELSRKYPGARLVVPRTVWSDYARFSQRQKSDNAIDEP